MVYIFTTAYNAEKTLHKAVNSILNQTYTDFCYYLFDNGSLDDTRKIIKEYANKDNRIIPLFGESNCRRVIPKIIKDIISGDNMLKNSYFATLDADDEYSPDFLEKMIDFVEDNNLEVATCGTEWIDEKTGQTIKKKVLNKNLILEGKEFADKFPLYRNFIVTLWGGIYSLELLKKCDFEWYHNAMNFSDTAFCMEAFRRAKRAGVLSESLHKYYISPSTVSYKYNPDWFYACKYLHKISREYLLDYGEISKQNENYLCVIFLILIKYILPKIQQADVKLPEKLKSLHNIFTDDMTKYVLEHWDEVGIYSNKLDFLHEIESWLYTQDGWGLLRKTVEEIITAMNI